MLTDALAASAPAEGTERHVIGAVVHDAGTVLVVRQSATDDFLPGDFRWVRATEVAGTTMTGETRRVLEQWFDGHQAGARA